MRYTDFITFDNNQLNWEYITNNIINYVNNITDSQHQYEGIVFLVDSILKTTESRNDIFPQFSKILKDGWDNTNLTRKKLSFLFTAPNSYFWVNEQFKHDREIKAYQLPHFSANTIYHKLNDKSNDKLNQIIHAGILLNFIPTHIEDLIDDYNDKEIILDKDSKCLNESLFGFDKRNGMLL